MKKLLLVIFVVLVSFNAVAQAVKTQPTDSLSFCPNTVTNGKIYITSKTTLEKEVSVYNVLGKCVLQTTTYKEVNISKIPTGVYIIKIKEGDTVVIRKLTVR